MSTKRIILLQCVLILLLSAFCCSMMWWIDKQPSGLKIVPRDDTSECRLI